MVVVVVVVPAMEKKVEKVEETKALSPEHTAAAALREVATRAAECCK